MRYSLALNVKWLYEYLISFEGTVIPETSEIKKTLGIAENVAIAKLLRKLQKDGLILWVHGGRLGNGQHHAIRIKGNNKLLKTEGCPFDI